jgi:AraC family transcriptional regulator
VSDAQAAGDVDHTPGDVASKRCPCGRQAPPTKKPNEGIQQTRTRLLVTAHGLTDDLQMQSSSGPHSSAPSSKGVLSRTTCQGQWSGVSAEAVEWRCVNESTFNLTSSRYRLGFVLEQGGGYCETRVHPGARDGYRHHGRPFFNFSPPDMQVWACSDEIQYTRSISLTFDKTTLSDRIDDAFDLQRHSSPRLNFVHPQLSSLAEMLAAECKAPGMFGDLYADSLIVAIMVGLMRLGNVAGTTRPQYRLAPWQLRAAMEYMDARVSSQLSLRDLAMTTGLSQSHFCRAFKASTGVAPYQCFLHAKIRRAQQLLLKQTASVAEVAAMSGFADQAHLTRAFSRATGATPAAWRRDRRR